MLFGFLRVGLFCGTSGSRNRHATITSKAFRPRLINLGRWRWVTSAGLGAYMLLVSGLPLLTLFWTSFLPYYQAPNLGALKQFTLENYQFILGYTAVGIALRKSLLHSNGVGSAFHARTPATRSIPPRWPESD